MDADLRASDADRDAAAAALREHFAAGRLTQDELDQRIAAAYAAANQADLRALTRDLPALPATPAQQRAELAERRAHLQRRLLQSTGGAVGAFLICTVLWLVSGAHGQFWPVWVALVAVIPLLRGGWRLYGPSPELDRLERELDERERSRRQQRGDRRLERGERRGRR